MGRVLLAVMLGAAAVACGANRVVYGIDAGGSGGEASTGAAGGAGSGGATTTPGTSGGSDAAMEVVGNAGDVVEAPDAGELTDAPDAGNVTYLGCRYLGLNIDAIAVSKIDTARGLCLNVALVSLATRGGGAAGLTLPPTYGRGPAGVVVPMSGCPAQGRPSLRSSPADVLADTVTGTVTAKAIAPDAGFGSVIDYVDVDLTLTFPANDAGAAATERLSALNVDVRPDCTH